ncbi:hypothetical protein IB234_15235 [Pseudomonas sp. PDM16]|uniref:hypothetical protein n=1 Tax=Pseudomonas sp. PDM16 TaxID=2769292 RepID=UPI001783759D|nr:hypothetical protein [Pseudomonas sp. PDM16]MBD9415915.1 hypothetical protein [Pseudomonas sp. PDM16]
MNIELLRALVLVGLAALCSAFGWQMHAWKVGYDESAQLRADQAQEKLARQLVAKVAQQTVEAIGGIRVTNTTIYQRTRQEIVREPMDPDCRIPASWMRQVNSARAGELRPEPAGAMPGAAASAGR